MRYEELLYSGQLDRLMAETLPRVEDDADARRVFLRMMMARDNVHLLSPSSIALLREGAMHGDRYAQYGFARYLTSVQPEKDSLLQAFGWATKAMEQGVADAKALVAAAYSFGDTGVINWDKEWQMKQEAYAEGSELAAMNILEDLCYGFHYGEPDEEQALMMADELIDRDEKAGIDPNGWWYYMRGKAVEHDEPRVRVVANYLKAVQLGILRAYMGVILAYGYDEEYHLCPTAQYRKWLAEGVAHRSSDALLMDALDKMNERTYVETEEEGELIYRRLTEAAKLGNTGAMEQMAWLFQYGQNGQEEDAQKAYEWYSMGAKHCSTLSTENLWRMLHAGIIERPEEEQEMLALHGARIGSKMLLAEAIRIFRDGGLAEYEEEILKYLEPAYVGLNG